MEGPWGMVKYTGEVDVSLRESWGQSGSADSSVAILPSVDPD